MWHVKLHRSACFPFFLPVHVVGRRSGKSRVVSLAGPTRLSRRHPRVNAAVPRAPTFVTLFGTLVVGTVPGLRQRHQLKRVQVLPERRARVQALVQRSPWVLLSPQRKHLDRKEIKILTRAGLAIAWLGRDSDVDRASIKHKPTPTSFVLPHARLM